MTYFAVVWLVVCIIMVIAELATLQFVSIWFAGGALLACISSFFLPFEWQFGIFAVSSFILLLLSMPLMKKLRNRKYIPTNCDMDIGREVVVTETINKKDDTGKAVLNGVGWLAISENEYEIIEKGETAIVKDIKGAKLVLAKK